MKMLFEELEEFCKTLRIRKDNPDIFYAVDLLNNDRGDVIGQITYSSYRDDYFIYSEIVDIIDKAELSENKIKELKDLLENKLEGRFIEIRKLIPNCTFVRGKIYE